MSEKFMYQTGNTFFEDLIIKVKVVKETDKFVTILRDNKHNDKPYEQREAKFSSWHQFHKTFEDAKNYLIEKSERKIKNIEEDLKREQEFLEKIKNTKECE